MVQPLPPETHKKLQDLRVLLENLPEALPVPPADESEYSLIGFKLDPAILCCTNGDVASAVCESFRAMFIDDGQTYLDERGESICVAADVLGKYLIEYPDNQGLLEWVRQLTNAARKVYKTYEKEVRKRTLSAFGSGSANCCFHRSL